MARLIYSMIASLDGYVTDPAGGIDWAEPDPEVFEFVNDLERSFGTYLYGRRMYETMAVWETLPTTDEPPFVAEFADIWRSANKVVYSTSLGAATTPRTRIESRFDPAAVRRMKADADRDLSINGPTLAARAFADGLVDECGLFITPVILGGGLSAFPGDTRVKLALEEERRFGRGTVYVRYSCAYPEHRAARG